MDRKHGKYVVSMEHPGKQSSSTCTNGQEAHHHTCWCPSSNDVTGNVSSNLSGVLVSPGILSHSECQSPEPYSTQVAGNSCGDWSLWKVFLASLLASMLTTAIGVLTLSLANRNNSPIVIYLPSNTEAPTVTPGTTSTTSQNMVATSTGSTTAMTSPETTATTATTATTTSTEPARTSTSTQPTTSAASTEMSATTAMAMTSTPPITTTATPMTSSGSMSTAASTQPTTSGAPTETSATTMDSTQHLTTSSTASSETTSTTSVTETNV
ncbi:dynactin-associated protein-like [Peromyscus eremicus]|uniref:dynactin-associated protein-like n=1 Tax=Peromyscus eremicus TaxID=42410 RepID=UPI0027DB54FD|nr:dynactin-associated protein-like [Peromyscus eremicus]